jgi:protein arginine kinase
MPAFDGGVEWLRGEGAASDVVMSSRVRLARNLAGFPFQTRASDEDRLRVLELCRRRLAKVGAEDEKSRGAGGEPSTPMAWVDLRELPAMDRDLLAERHLISRQHAKGKLSSGKGGPERPRAVAVALPSEKAAVMVNEEDHLRVQAIRSGLALREAWENADHLDDELEAGLDYAFSARFGYLTCCPTNVGTGARFSVMLHLPALRLVGDIEKVKRAADDMGLAVRGFYGEGSEAAGDFYQISNQTTLGKSEGLLLHELEKEIVPRIVEYERHARRTLLGQRRLWLEDQTQRALGLLRHARLLKTEEAMTALSLARLGVVAGVLGEGTVDQRTLNGLMLLVQPAHLQRACGAELDQAARAEARATLVRTRLR